MSGPLKTLTGLWPPKNPQSQVVAQGTFTAADLYQALEELGRPAKIRVVAFHNTKREHERSPHYNLCIQVDDYDQQQQGHAPQHPGGFQQPQYGAPPQQGYGPAPAAPPPQQYPPQHYPPQQAPPGYHQPPPQGAPPPHGAPPPQPPQQGYDPNQPPELTTADGRRF